MTVTPAPITQPLVDENALPTLPWALFFNQTFQGDRGNSWNANFVDLTGTTSSASGRFYRISQSLVYFVINVVPDGSTSAVAGTTYIDNFPLTFNNDGFNTIVSGTAGGAIGVNKSSNNRIYVPAWTTVSDPITIIGLVEAT